MVRKWEEPTDDRHPSIDNTTRFPIDALLRSKGFEIHLRPRKGQPLWVRWEKGRRRIYKQSHALSTLDPNDVSDAQYLEDLYSGK